MTSIIKYYLSIFLRRLPYFLIVATAITAVAFIVALTLPASYVSRTTLIVESPQIPTELASSTVRTPALEQLQIMQQRLLTRENLLDIARELDVLPGADSMSPDQIVQSMQARTDISKSTGRQEATFMQMSFEAPDPRDAAGVLNQYLSLIQQEDAAFRQGRAGETLDFFEREVDRLSGELDKRNKRIRKFKREHSGALPSGLEFRLSEQSRLQERITQIGRQIASLKNQREQMIQVFKATGSVSGRTDEAATPAQQRLRDLRAQLDKALVVFSEQNPKVKNLRARIAQAKKRIAEEAESATEGNSGGAAKSPERSVLDVQLEQLEARQSVLEKRKKVTQNHLDEIQTAIKKTPANSLRLQELQREASNISAQYNTAVDRLAKARTGERIELRSRGQRISVIDQPSVPTEPSKPNRLMIAGGGGVFGIMAGLGLIVLLELLNKSARRPEDLVNRFGISPLTSIPYIQTRREKVVQRSLRLGVIAVILVGVPALVYAVHVFYQPLDLIADRVMNAIGLRL